MNRHPGGREESRRLIERAELPEGASVLDMGAGEGETVGLLLALGFDGRGIDLAPRGEDVEQGDFLHAPYPDGSFDAVIGECSFFISGDQAGALREAHRLLKIDGKLLLSDVFFEAPWPMLTNEGFEVLHAEDRTENWREYYLEALWRDESPCCDLPKGKASYFSLIGRKV